MPPPPSPSHNKKKLNEMLGDGTFEKLMKERTKLRKEKDEHVIAELRVKMTSMENALTAEIKRRIDMNRQLETKCSTQIHLLENQFTEKLEENTQNLTQKLSDLEDKLNLLNIRLEESTTKIPQDVEMRGKELRDSLERFKQDFFVEKQERLKREGRLMKQFHDYEESVEKRLIELKKERVDTVEELRTLLKKSEEERIKTQEKFENFLKEQLNLLTEQLETEIRERKEEDDDIVSALNRYTLNLQSSLSVLSSVDE
eukprot:CAMPEP_0178974152 /NCGR_PEP_ID=MMETSP0789-20121207/22258_1 /TAXON_ID=3005 /ORGANISM="Rhizosolenia setigera, Strain CCMP 1694" /LENGTH=256 /DNA_ID=CAMNT_0020662375 /DNA_START=36 /DNA_END=806 /DNA_ORIENTATION=+